MNKANPNGRPLQSHYMDAVDTCTDCKLRSSRFFCEFEPEIFDAFSRITTPCLYPKGATLFSEGQAPRGIFVLCRGRMKLSICSGDGITLIIGLVNSGEVLGLNATISGKPYGVTVETIEPCQVVMVGRTDFLQFIKQNPDVSRDVSQHLSRHFNAAYSRIRLLGLSQTVRGRLATLLLEWGITYGKQTSEGICFERMLTHEEIGRMISSSRESISRTIGELAANQIIGVDRAKFTIRNQPALEALAGV